MIENIIFDFGDVFINLDKEATAREMHSFGFNSITADLEYLFIEYEKGLITTEDFLNSTNKLFPKASKSDLMRAWNAIILDFPEERLRFIENLAQKKEYRLFLLSNTNEMHIEFVKKQMGEERYNRFESSFERFYLSHEIHLRKPEPEIFEYVLHTNNLNPEKTLFIDDTEGHTLAAKELGISIWHLKVGKEDILDLNLLLL